MKQNAQWRGERPWVPAVAQPPPLLHTLPGGQPTGSPPDQMHTWHHGVGREFAASTVAPLQHTHVAVMPFAWVQNHLNA